LTAPFRNKPRKLCRKYAVMFSLDRPNSKTETFIFLRLRCIDGPLKYPVKKKALPGNWMDGRLIKDLGKINLVLNKIETSINQLYLQRDLTGTPITKTLVTTTLDKALGRNTAAHSFYEAIDRIIDERERGGELTRNGKRFSWHTIKGYRHTVSNLKKFDPNMTFEKITLNTYAELIAFFNKDKDHSLNALGKTVKNWKVFLKVAHKKGLHQNLVYLHEDFRVPGENTDDVYLTQKELEAIYHHNLPNKNQDIVRDWFVIDCYTGLRISDIKLLGKENVLKDTIRIVNEKTDTRVEIPINSFIRAILKKWKGLPPKVTDQEMNRAIKEVCELAGIKEPVLYSITKGGIRRDFHFKKYEMVSNHTARRAFITNLLNDGVPDNTVMQLAGIKKHATLMKYKKTKPEETAKLMKGKSIFK
jgi:integrase